MKSKSEMTPPRNAVPSGAHSVLTGKLYFVKQTLVSLRHGASNIVLNPFQFSPLVLVGICAVFFFLSENSVIGQENESGYGHPIKKAKPEIVNAPSYGEVGNSGGHVGRIVQDEYSHERSVLLGLGFGILFTLTVFSVLRKRRQVALS